ncbi:membrane dipeptidase [Neoroseomonas lacus]|uniref:Membrane dipeptidase n=2 Tax=Neoroseomonas lacus TaxID=287609 RepID=A0A917L5B4_9PROT|nr:membrane dipeptidase [Neoroseomonas lacus]
MNPMLIWDMTLSWNRRFRDRVTLPRLHAAGYGVVGLTVGGDLSTEARREAEAGIAAVVEWIAAEPARYVLIRTTDDVLHARRDGKLGIELNFQGIGPLEGSIELIGHFHALGIRHIGLVWNDANLAGSSATRGADTGLTQHGRALIHGMERAGIMVDGAHASYRTVMEAIDACAKPFIISHANVASLAPSYKNLTDDQISACAATGGVIGVSGLGSYLDDPRAMPDAMYRQIDHVAQLVGPAHVGLGLDYVTDAPLFWRMVRERPEIWPAPDGGPMAQSLFFEPERVHDLAALLDRAGYAVADIGGILGGNWQRVAAACWAAG